MAHLWPLLAFIAGVTLASHIKSGRVERAVPRPLVWTMAIQAVALAIIGFVPASVPHSYVTVPISFLAAMQIGLFRSIGDLAYLPVATTGNMMRFVEAGYDGFVEKKAGSRKAFGVYGALILAFASGALIGAIASRAWGVHAIWLPAGFLAVTLCLFIIDERSRGELPSRHDAVADGPRRRDGVAFAGTPPVASASPSRRRAHIGCPRHRGRKCGRQFRGEWRTAAPDGYS